ncbi:glycosyltransferase family 61 protein [Roseovarius sp. SK2]|uniref:glycosyltransferase family 61 protein n=1 Tax=Roseovarius TaxID=74030 RepID=UPI00237A6A31|nr:glycosyltransferase family 61 protein [Roseovarius sp. SK2]MDD9726877.1 glycosyltransferase family 61 protein [Roseovarius sp. SK2]
MMDDAASGAGLDPRILPEPRIETVEQALVAPMPEGRELACGVFRADRSFVEQSRTLYSSNRFTAQPDFPEAAESLSGRHLFIGIGRHHFGHFLLECISRLWPLSDGGHDGLVLIPMHGIDFGAVFQRRLKAFVDLLSDGLPVHFVQSPVRIEELDVPTQGMGHRDWISGTPEFRRFIRGRLQAVVTPEGDEKIYLSRSLLKRAGQMVDQEERIERLMLKAGYTILHPQRHSLPEQCARYAAARQIVGPDGSAFHLAPFVMRPGTKVGLIQRRWRQGAFDALVNQIDAFCDVDLVKMNPLLRPDDGQVSEDVPPPLDYRRLVRKLEAGGFL